VTCHGHITWAGEHISSMATDRRARTIAYLSQAPAAHWPFRAASLVELGRLPHRRFGEKAGASDHAAVRSALSMTGTSQLADRRISELSGGEVARVQLARALCVGAPALLVDEPTARLDPYHQLHIMSALKRYTKDGNLVVAVLHDLTLAARFCDRAVLIDQGGVAADGTPRSVLTAETLRAIYGVEALIAEHGGQLVVVPWRQCHD
jgi:iron complex transport system ATP-binding protein